MYRRAELRRTSCMFLLFYEPVYLAVYWHEPVYLAVLSGYTRCMVLSPACAG